MANLKDALGTLGLRPCSLCGKFYPISNPGNIFTIRDAICYACLSGWWPDHRRSLDQADRQLSESKLSDWLTRYHNAQVFREFKDLPPKELPDLTFSSRAVNARAKAGCSADAADIASETARSGLSPGRDLSRVVLSRHLSADFRVRPGD